MKIGLDFHGVINQMPKFFSCINKALINDGHEIHIITGGTKKEVEKYCKKNKIVYTILYAMIDTFIKKGKPHLKDKQGRYTFNNVDWNKEKGKYCKQNKIDFHFDDTIDYASHFKTPFFTFRKEN